MAPPVTPAHLPKVSERNGDVGFRVFFCLKLLFPSAGSTGFRV